jgi:hypothetical protein
MDIADFKLSHGIGMGLQRAESPGCSLCDHRPDYFTIPWTVILKSGVHNGYLKTMIEKLNTFNYPIF